MVSKLSPMVVETEGKALDMTSVRAVEFYRVELRAAAPHFIASAGASHVHSVRVAR
jgi:hypothetical protein